ncbi:MAG: DNA translocase FtsK [Tissierellia bacterium]|nr:DNA translocase FtsK 4TM domain-containing protein [Bacillota bacterium]NLL22185.1 DNA translocase FtsK [Tissierellia bacterium]
MAPKKKTTTKTKEKEGLRKEVRLLLWLALSLFLLFSLFTSSTGLFGGVLGKAILGLFGISGYLLPVILPVWVVMGNAPSLERHKYRVRSGMVIAFVGVILLSGFIHAESIRIAFDQKKTISVLFSGGHQLKTAGLLGSPLSFLVDKFLGRAGHMILIVVLLLTGIFFITSYSIIRFIRDMKSVAEKGKEISKKRKSREPVPSVLPEEPRELPKFLSKEPPERQREIPVHDYDHAFVRQEEEGKGDNEAVHEPAQVVKKEENAPTEQESRELEEDISRALAEKGKKVYKKPSVSLLHPKQKSTRNTDRERQEVLATAKKLEETLESFGVIARVVGITRGPIVNRFEMELEPGTKISRVSGLSDDIALHLGVAQVRVAPVPAKAAVGIEVPTKQNDIVTIRDMLGSKEFLQSASPLSFVLGKDIAGKPVVANLASMPHLLIAGSTGSGKSVCVNTIITSFLFRNSPDEVKLLMIDPKVVELSGYNGIPHLILPVVTDPKKAAIALGWAVNQMTERYELFADAGCRDIDSYNQANPENKLPRIVVLIDELADLMMVAPNQVEDSIARISQMARAAGIHLIVATQRPSADVITGLIKTNIPARIAFSVSSAIDSRIILDMGGAEKLLGRGDMLFLPPTSSKPRRIQGAFIADEEIQSVVRFIKNQDMEVEYDENVVQGSVEVETRQVEDELLPDAIRVVLDQRSASASLLQRKFRIGYSRAGRLVDMMEERGIVGPPQGSKPREVLVDFYDIQQSEEEA